MAADVTVLVPTLDEAETIEDVVAGFREQGFERVLVVDGGSTDGTRELAREAGARVLEQTGDGKGKAVRQGVAAVETEYVLLVDGDGTYRPAEAERLLEPLRSGRAEHVIGNRFADMHPDAMSRLNRVGNRLINWAYRTIHGRQHHDILSGYRAFTRDSFERLVLSADGFGIETELTVECVREGIEVVEVPITYLPRPDGSETNLQPFRDGGTIVLTLYRLAKTNNPLFYFGSVGTVSLVVGSAFALFVGYRWIVAGVGHEVLAVVAAAGIMVGLQLLIFGVLSDMIVSLHGDQRRRIERLERELDEARGVLPGADDSTARSGADRAGVQPPTNEPATGEAATDDAADPVVEEVAGPDGEGDGPDGATDGGEEGSGDDGARRGRVEDD